MSNLSVERLAIAALVGASLLWGASWWPLKALAAEGLSGLPQVFVCYGAVGLLLSPLLFLQFRQWRPDARLMGAIFVLGGLANITFPWALVHGEVVRVMVLFYLLPVWGVLGGRIFLGEHIDRQRLIAVVLALSGALLVLGGPELLATPPSVVDLVALASGFFFAMNNICFRAAQRAPVPAKVAAVFLGCGLLTGFAVALQAEPFPAIEGAAWGLAAATALLVMTATAGTQLGVTHLEAGRSSLLIILELVAAVVTATWWAGETLSPMEWLGGLLILSAAVLEAWRPATSSGAAATA